MLYHEFKEWLEENAIGYKVFMEKAAEYQSMKNKDRSGKKKWNNRKVEKATQRMWGDVVKAAYEQIRAHEGVPKYNGKQIWLDFMEKYNFLEGFNEGASETEFE